MIKHLRRFSCRFHDANLSGNIHKTHGTNTALKYPLWRRSAGALRAVKRSLTAVAQPWTDRTSGSAPGLTITLHDMIAMLALLVTAFVAGDVTRCQKFSVLEQTKQQGSRKGQPETSKKELKVHLSGALPNCATHHQCTCNLPNHDRNVECYAPCLPRCSKPRATVAQGSCAARRPCRSDSNCCTHSAWSSADRRHHTPLHHTTPAAHCQPDLRRL